MSFLLGVVIFVVAILISVILHEAGHFLTAKKFGMQATQFFIGFRATLWSTTRGEAAPVNEPRPMRNKPAWQRAIVMVAGSFMHFALAFVLLLGLALGIGRVNYNANTNSIGAVSSCVPASVKLYEQGSCAGSKGASPA